MKLVLCKKSQEKENLFNFTATYIQVHIYFCPLFYAIPVRLQENPYWQIQSHINEQVLLEKTKIFWSNLIFKKERWV